MRNFFLVLLSLICAVALVAQENKISTNKEILQYACEKALTQAITDFSLSPESFLSVELGRNNLRNDFLRTSILKTLLQFSKNIYSEKIAADTLLRLNVERIQMYYSEPFTEGWFQSKKTIRTAEIELTAELAANSSGKILFAKNIAHVQQDTIFYSQLTEVENINEPLTIGKKPAPTFLQNLIEPAILTIAAGIAVYLFFTVRS